MGGGRRDVYNRQVGQVKLNNPEMAKKMLDEILDQEQHQYFDYEADHWLTICHENTHSLGPIITDDQLGEYSHNIEENKADKGALVFLNLLENKGYYTEEQKKKIIVTFIFNFLINEKPLLTQ